ncbi:MAG: heavy metal translocating P-type ATPase [bacterium]
MQISLEIPVIMPGSEDCERCVSRLWKTLSQARGVEGIDLDPQGRLLVVSYDPNLTSVEKIYDEARKIGMKLGERYSHEILDLGDLDCADCARTLERALSQRDGMLWASVNFPASKMEVEYDAGKIDLRQIASEIERLGYSVKSGGHLHTSVFYIPEMDCDEEIALIRGKLISLPGVEDLDFNLMSKKVTVVHRLSPNEIVRALREIKMTPRVEGEVDGEGVSFWEAHKRVMSTAASGLFTAVGFILSLSGASSAFTIPAFAAAMVSGGWFVARKGYYALRNLALDMNFLMTLAVIGAAAIGEWLEGAVVIFLFSLANLLESFSMDRARNAIKSLMDLSPDVARVRKDSEETQIPVDGIGVGDIVLVRPGERIPLDGVVREGSSSVDQSPITGESIPVEKGEGDCVFAGTINGEGYLEVEVTKLSRDTTLARIIHSVEEAQSRKAPSQNFVDRFARHYTPCVVAAAALTAVVPPLFWGLSWGTWFYRALVLLVVACPCALVISTPVTIVSGLARAARDGILIKGGVYLEGMGSLGAIAFDKTGTLTVGKPSVTDVVPLNSQSEEDVLRIAASIESRSEHHLARAILDRAFARGIDPSEPRDFQSIAGRGAAASIDGRVYYIGNHRLFEERGWCSPDADGVLEGFESEGKTAVMLGNSDGILGIIAIADVPREGARWAIGELKRNGMKTVMLTGDNRATAQAISDQLGMDEYRAELLPEDKVRAVGELVEEHRRVAMVGDGVNDAPALASATVGIAMGTAGTDAALETADVALMSDDLTKLPAAVRLSRKVLAIVKENIAFSLLIKAAFIALTPLGFTTLWMAVGADMGASLLVIGNGMRALRKGTVYRAPTN